MNASTHAVYAVFLRRFACSPAAFLVVWGGQTERETPLCNLKLYAACFGVCVGLAALVGVLSGRLGVRGFEIGFSVLGAGYLVGVAALVTSFLFTFRRDRVVE